MKKIINTFLLYHVQREYKKYIESNISDRVKTIQEKVTRKCDKKIKELKDSVEDIETIRDKIIRVYDKRDMINKNLEDSMYKAIKRYFDQWEDLDILTLYKGLISDCEKLEKYSNGELDKGNITFISDYSKKIFDNEMLEREDLAALLYLHLKLEGLSLKRKV